MSIDLENLDPADNIFLVDNEVDTGDFNAADLPRTELVHVRNHEFITKSGARHGKNARCAICNRGETTVVDHYGFPPSSRVLGSGDRFAYQTMKQMWQEQWIYLLERTDFPRGLGFIRAEGTITFGDRSHRDQGNFRFMIEKSLGDALQEARYFKSKKNGKPGEDDWAHFSFGDLHYNYEKDHEQLIIRLFGEWEPHALPGGGMAD